MPLTIVYGTLATCADALLFFSQHLDKEQYFPTGADHISKNRLFAQFHAEYPQHEKDRILDETVQGMCKARVLFLTLAFATAQSCKRKTILDYLEHEVPKRTILHSCCDFHKLNCNCETCIENTIVEEMGECSIKPPAKEISANSLSTCLVPVTPDQQDEICSEREAYRASLQFGKTWVGGVTLSTGFSLELIVMTIEHCDKLVSVEIVEEILPVFSRRNAEVIYDIVSRHVLKQQH